MAVARVDSLVMDSFFEKSSQLVQIVVLDEAHAVVQDVSFRPCMKAVKHLRFTCLVRRQVVLLSATCAPTMKLELEDALLVDLRIFRHSTPTSSRDNLEFHLAVPIEDPVNAVGEYIALFTCVADDDMRAIMFVDEVAHCEHVAGAVRRHGTPAKCFNCSMPREGKAKVLMD